ncbi:MAG: hypothetical protein AAGB46_07375 [Verrucomicrobiota bacterium]
MKLCVGMTALIGGMSTGIVALIAIFSPSYLPVAGWIVSALCLMGGTMGYMITKADG